jgi:hypothetical protein
MLIGRGNIKPRLIVCHRRTIVDAEFVDYTTPFIPGQGKVAMLVCSSSHLSEARSRLFKLISAGLRLPDFGQLEIAHPELRLPAAES